MNFLELAAARFSVRKYKEQMIEEEKMQKILEAGRLAPTAVNLQPQKIYVLKGKKAMEKLGTVCQYTFGAPQALLVCYDEERAWKNRFREGYNSGEVDSAIVATHMMLEAWELGIGSCWVGAFNADALAAAFELPEHIRPVAVLTMGYAAEDAKPYKKMHNVYRPMEEMVEELQV